MRDSNSIPPRHSPPSLFGEGGPVGKFPGTPEWQANKGRTGPGLTARFSVLKALEDEARARQSLPMRVLGRVLDALKPDR